jgi:hypothetical protein
MDQPDPKGASGPPASRVSLGGRLRRGLEVPPGLDVEAAEAAARAPAVVGADSRNATWFLPVRVVADGGSSVAALLRGVRLDGGDGASPEALDRWRSDHAMIASGVRRVPGFPRALPGIPISDAVVLPPYYYCTEKRVFIAAPDGPTDPKESLWRVARQGKPAGPEAAEIACLACGERDRCYPASGPSDDPGTAGARLAAISDRPWGGLIVEPFHLPFPAWLRLASGESWRAVRSSLGAWPPSLIGELDRIFAAARPMILGPEHGESFALETFLLRLEWLRQTLVTLRELVSALRRPHLGIAPESIALSVDAPGAWGASLWTSRVVVLATGANRSTGDGNFEPVPGRSAAMVPPDCRGGAAWVRGRCLPRGTAKTLTSAKTWEFNFLPSESAAQAPSKGTPVRFAIDQAGEPSGPPVDGRVDVAFRDVWAVTVTDPRRWEEAIRDMLLRDDGRPAIVMQAVSDHSLADDLFAVGTLWLSSLVAEPGSIPSAVRLRQALRGAPADAARIDAAEASGPCHYVTHESAPPRRLAADLIESALELGNRLCGGVAGAYPGQGHEPVPPDARAKVYDAMLAEVARLAAEARHRLVGYAPADAEIRAVLEGALRSS